MNGSDCRTWTSKRESVLGWALALIFVPRLIFALPAVGDAVRAALPHPPDRAAFNAEMLVAALGHDFAARMLRIREHQRLIGTIAANSWTT